MPLSISVVRDEMNKSVDISKGELENSTVLVMFEGCINTDCET